MNRRHFLANFGKLGLFTILPGAGRVWKAQRDLVCVRERIITRPIPAGYWKFLPSFQDFIKAGMMPRAYQIPMEPIIWPHNMGDTK